MNVIWIVADTFRRDHLGAYGNRTIRTPSLDALAARSVRFDGHYSAGFPTMPTRADHQTGRWTMSFMGWQALPEGVTTLAEMLAERGLHTAASVDTPYYLRDGMNYDRGFQSFFMNRGQDTMWSLIPQPGYHNESLDVRAAWHNESDRNAPRTFMTAIQWLEHHYKEDFFLYVDTWDPHEPWDAPSYYTELYWPGYDGELVLPVYGNWHDVPGYEEEKLKKGHATYCGEITMVDTWVGFLAEVGREHGPDGQDRNHLHHGPWLLLWRARRPVRQDEWRQAAGRKASTLWRSGIDLDPLTPLRGDRPHTASGPRARNISGGVQGPELGD